jgi:hypothetical protein
LRYSLNQRQTLFGTVIIANRSRRSEIQTRSAASLVRRHSGPNIVFRLQGDMLFDLFLQAFVIPAVYCKIP